MLSVHGATPKACRNPETYHLSGTCTQGWPRLDDALDDATEVDSMSVPGQSQDREYLAERLRRAAELVRAEIREGRFQRSMAVITIFSAIVSGFEAYVQHVRGAFSHWLMWTPVLLTVPTVLAAGAALFSETAVRVLLPLAALASIVDGIVGFVFHIRGVARMPGGFNVGQYNVVMGPPIFAPLLLCSVGVIGLLASFLRREQLPRSRLLPGPFSVLTPAPARDLGSAGMTGRFAADIAHGRFQRIMALASAFFAILAGGEVYFEHLRGSFNQRVMWLPVWITPPMLAAAIGAVRSERVARTMLPIISAITFVFGLLGFLLHLRGIRRMPGGFSNLQFNVTLGPPLFAPLLFTAVGLLGVIAALLRRR